jgi:hypothetical protein
MATPRETKATNPTEQTNNILPCCVCGKELKAALKTTGNGAPLRALIFSATGNFGSALFDPPSFVIGAPSTYLKIHICDKCIETKATEGRVSMVTVNTTKTYEEVPWKGTE